MHAASASQIAEALSLVHAMNCMALPCQAGMILAGMLEVVIAGVDLRLL